MLRCDIRWCSHDSTWKHAGIFFGGVRSGLIEGNSIHDCKRCGGIYVMGGSEEVSVLRNAIRRCGYVGIWFMGAPRCQMVRNTVDDNLGTHSNALTVYHGSDGAFLFGNRVRNSQIAVSLEKVKDVTLAYNDLHSPSYTVVSWFETVGTRVFNNTLMSDEKKALYLSLRDTRESVVRNNILEGLLIAEPYEADHNLFVGHFQGWSNLPEKVRRNNLWEPDLAKVFADPQKKEYRLREGSPAVDAGVDLGLSEDCTGGKVPIGGGPDLGAYEYLPRP